MKTVALAIRSAVFLAISMATGEWCRAQSDAVDREPPSSIDTGPADAATRRFEKLLNGTERRESHTKPVVEPASPPELIVGFYDGPTVAHFPAPIVGKPVRLVTAETDAVATDAVPRDAYRLHDQAPFIYGHGSLFLSAAPRLQRDFAWIWLEGYDAGTRSHTHTWPEVGLYRIPGAQFLDGSDIDWTTFLKSWGDEDWGRVRRLTDAGRQAEETSQSFYGQRFECIDRMAWPPRNMSRAIRAENSRQWNERCRCDLAVLDSKTVEVYVVNKNAPLKDSTDRLEATLRRYVGKFEAVRYQTDFGTPSWRGEWRLVQTVPMSFCGPFVAVRRPDRLYIVPSQGRVRSIEVADDQAEKPPVLPRDVTGQDSVDPMEDPAKADPAKAEPVKLVLIGNDPADPVYAFTERRWFEVKDPIEYRPFDLGDVDESDPLPALVRAVREVRQPAVPNKADPAGAKQ